MTKFDNTTTLFLLNCKYFNCCQIREVKVCSQTLEWILQSEGRAKPVLPWVNGIALALSLASKKGKTYLSITKDLQNDIQFVYWFRLLKRA